MKKEKSVFAQFNKAAIAASLAATLLSGAAFAQDNAPQTGMTAIIRDGYANNAVAFSVPVKDVKGCYNALASTLATHRSGQEVTMACLDSDGQLAASVYCDSVASWNTFSPVCTDTTEKSRSNLFPLNEQLLKSGPVTGPSR